MPRRMSKKEDDQLNTWQLLSAIGRIIKISFKISPAAIGFKFISAIVDGLVPLITAYLAAQTITQITYAFNGVDGADTKAVWFIVATAGVGLIQAFKGSFLGYIDQLVRYKVEISISDMLYERFVQLEFWRYDDKESIDLYNKAQDFTNFFAYVFDRIARLFSSLFGLISAVLALSILSPWLSVAMFTAIFPGMVLQYKISRFQVMHWRKNITARRKLNYIEYNMIKPEKISELRIYGLARTMLSLRQKYRDQDKGIQLEFEKRYLKWRAAIDILESTIQLGSLLWVVTKIAAKKMPIGQFVYAQQLVSTALSSASMFISEYGSADEDLAKLKDYNDFMELPIMEKASSKLTTVQTIEFKKVSFTYSHSETEVLSDVSININAGDHIAVVGENGAGKSTFIKLLLGLYAPTKGEILINGISIEKFDISTWHKNIAVLMQDFITFQFLNLKENIVYGDVEGRYTQSRLNHAIDAAQADEVVSSTSKGLDTLMGTWFEEEGGTQLSGGQWQRVALARNFYRRAPIVILDEPTSAVDALAEAKIFDRLFDKSNNNTLVAISHRLTTIEGADKIFVFKEGKIVQEGKHEELAADKNGHYVKMFRRQLKSEK